MYNKINETLDQLKQGKLIIIVDETREKESDLMLAAEFADEKSIPFMIRYTSGILTVPITKTRAEELQLSLMVENNTDKHCTNFTVSVDAIHTEMTTGVSAKDRLLTIKTILNGNAAQLSKPGHVFPLIAKNSLLDRQGHTEASVTLCKLADLKEVAVISELANDDGTMMSKEQALQFAKEHNLAVISISQILDEIIK